MRFLRKLLGETDALEEATREAGGDIREGEGQVEAPEAPTMPEEPPELPQDDQKEPGVSPAD
jgi:hypothetical protein